MKPMHYGPSSLTMFGATADPTQHTCRPCGGIETLLHRLWTCPNNNLCTHPAVAQFQNLIGEAVGGCPQKAAFWLAGVLAGKMLPVKHPRVMRKDCNPKRTGDFERLLRLTGRCGVDGSGGKLSSSQARFRTVGAGCGVILMSDCEDGPWVVEEAHLASRYLADKQSRGPKPGLSTLSCWNGMAPTT